MFRLVLCLVFIILRAEANVLETENPVIRLSYGHNHNENYVVWKDKPLKIIIENGPTRYVRRKTIDMSEFQLKKLYVKVLCDQCGQNIYCRCYSKYGTVDYGPFVKETEFKHGIIQIINITHVTAAMSTRWACTALEEFHGPPRYEYNNRVYTATDFVFNLHVKGAKAVTVIANNQSLTYETTNLSVNYDGETNYTYGDGEDFPMEFSCEKAERSSYGDTLRLEYYNAEGIPLFQTKPRVRGPHIFRSVLKSNNDKYYLDCIRAAKDPKREYRYRTTFFKRDSPADAVQHAVILSVNGQKLTTTLNKTNKSFDDYTFRYIDGEVLNVTCRKIDVKMRGSLTFHFEEFVHKITKTLRSSSEAIISLNTSLSDIRNKSLTCGINNTDVEKPNARLLFTSDVPDYGVRICGLSRNNVLYQYSNDLDQWTIEYQYSVNESLDLTCVRHKGFQVSSYRSPYSNRFQWEFEGHAGSGEKFDSTEIEVPNTKNTFSDRKFTKVLNAAHNGTKIKCSYFPKDFQSTNKTVEIILRLKLELVTEVKRGEDTSDNSVASRTVPIAVGAGAIIAIITMLCLVLWRKRTKRVNLLENAYDTLSNQNDSPIPAFPSQWEDNHNDANNAKIDDEVMQENYNYSSDNDKLYSSLYKRQSNTSENHYTEIDDYFKRKPHGLAANWNIPQPSNHNKQTDTPEATSSQISNNACYNSFSDSKQHTYDKLRHNNLPINNDHENYSKIQEPSKGKSATFRQMSKDCRNSIRNVKPNNDSYYANTGHNGMQPGDMHKKPNYENGFLQNEKTDNPLDSDYAEPYDEISYKNDLYG